MLKMHNVENTNRQWWYFCFIFAETITYLVTTDWCKLLTFLMQNANSNDACPVKNRHFINCADLQGHLPSQAFQNLVMHW